MSHASFAIIQKLLDKTVESTHADWAEFRQDVWTMEVLVPGERKKGSDGADGIRLLLSPQEDSDSLNLSVCIFESGMTAVDEAGDYLVMPFSTTFAVADIQASVTLRYGAEALHLSHLDLSMLHEGWKREELSAPMSDAEFSDFRVAVHQFHWRARKYCAAAPDVASLRLLIVPCPGMKAVLLGVLCADHREVHAQALQQLVKEYFRFGWNFVLVDPDAKSPSGTEALIPWDKLAPCYEKGMDRNWWSRLKRQLTSKVATLELAA